MTTAVGETFSITPPLALDYSTFLGHINSLFETDFDDLTELKDNIHTLTFFEASEVHPLPKGLQNAFHDLLRILMTENITESEILCYICEKDKIHKFVTELDDNDDIINAKKVFEIEKNKMITFASKNSNIQDRLYKNKMWRYSLLFGLLFFIIGLSTIYYMGRTSKQQKLPFDLILISVSMMCVFFFIIMDLIILFSRRTVSETFVDSCATEDCQYNNNVFPNINSKIMEFFDDLVTIHRYNHTLQVKDVRKQTEVVNALLNDYKRVNYINLRNFQLTNYKLNATRYNMHFIKWGFIIAGIIGIFAGLNIRKNSSYPVSDMFFITIATTVTLMFFIIFLLNQKQHMIRKKYNWDKLYWRIKSVEKAT